MQCTLHTFHALPPLNPLFLPLPLPPLHPHLPLHLPVKSNLPRLIPPIHILPTNLRIPPRQYIPSNTRTPTEGLGSPFPLPAYPSFHASTHGLCDAEITTEHVHF